MKVIEGKENNCLMRIFLYYYFHKKFLVSIRSFKSHFENMYTLSTLDLKRSNSQFIATYIMTRGLSVVIAKLARANFALQNS